MDCRDVEALSLLINSYAVITLPRLSDSKLSASS